MKPSVKETDKKRLQVFLSHSGLCSRRKAMDLILQGHVSVNGSIVCEPSMPVNEHDKILLGGAEVSARKFEYIMLNKPKGYITTLEDRHAPQKVTELLPAEYRHLYPAGRLDKDTEGLLLFTNDGEAAFRLTHPKFNVDKTYFVKIKGSLAPRDKTQLEKGIMVGGKLTAPAKINNLKIEGNFTYFHLTIHEGRKRQIRYMLAKLRYFIVELKRILQGPLKIGDLKVGAWRKLTVQEIAQLKKI